MEQFTLDQYHQMIRLGILPSGTPVELLDGVLVPKDRSKTGESPASVGFQHSYVNDLLLMVGARLPHTCYLRTQQPITLPPSSEPEPDASIVRGIPRTYVGRLPTAEDTIAVVEVSDNSLRHDRTTKLGIYARAGIKQYVIVNLIDGVIEDHHDPIPFTSSYERRATLYRGDVLTMTLPDDSTFDVPVSEILD